MSKASSTHCSMPSKVNLANGTHSVPSPRYERVLAAREKGNSPSSRKPTSHAPLSFFEYGHAAAGASGKTLEPPRIITMVLEGESTLAPRQWEEALRLVVDANHGVPLRIHGVRQRARWTREGALPPGNCGLSRIASGTAVHIAAWTQSSRRRCRCRPARPPN